MPRNFIRLTRWCVRAAFALLSSSSIALAQMDDKQARLYLGHKFPQLVNTTWRLYSETVGEIGTPEEKAALARLNMVFDKDDYGAPVVGARCSDTRCTLRLNASFVGLATILALSGAASSHLNSPAGRAVKCFADNVDSLAKSILSLSPGNPYVPLLPCLGKPGLPPQTLIDDQRYNDLADIAAIETLAFSFAHELAHVVHGDFDPGNQTRGIRDMEMRADIAAVEFLARAGIDSFFGAGATGVFRLAEELSTVGARGDYPAVECRMLYAVFAGGYFLLNLDRSKLRYDSQYEKELRFGFFDWKIAEATAFVETNMAKTKDRSCDGYFSQPANSP
jgi:hypothetical protein